MPFGTGTFSLRFVEQETLTKQKRSFNATFSFHRGKWNFISLRLLVQRHIAESKWELGNQNPQEKGHFSTFHSLFFNKHSTAIMNSCHILTTKYYFLWFLLWNYLCPTRRGLRWKISPDHCPSTVEVKAACGVSSLFLSPYSSQEQTYSWVQWIQQSI